MVRYGVSDVQFMFSCFPYFLFRFDLNNFDPIAIITAPTTLRFKDDNEVK